MGEEKGDPVGYGKPPRHSQFKVGKSGNPSGRPKKEGPSISQTIWKELNTSVTVIENGRTQKMPKARAIVKQHAMKAMKGDVKSTELLFKQCKQTEPDSDRGLLSLLDEMRGIDARQAAADRLEDASERRQTE